MKFWVRPALVTVLVATGPVPGLDAQRYCYRIAPGDTAARLAEALTGDAGNRHASWFQIVDDRWQTVSKVDYDVVHPGWLACLDHGQLASARSGISDWRPAADAPKRRATAVLGSSVDFTFVAIAALILSTLSGWRFVVRHNRRSRERARAMRRFGMEFVREFGRPLTQFRGAEPLPRSRVRIQTRRSQLEILLAPAEGRSYPNLSDHKGNV
jgi:hypothetical protein